MDLQQRKKDYSLDDGLDELERGFWIGNCCFISCQKQRPKQQTMIQKKKNAYKNAASPEDRSRGRRRCCVFLFFLAAVLLSLMSFLLWPRTPLIRVEGGSLISPVSITETGHGTLVGNVQFESQWLVHFTVDNRANWLVPTRFIQVHLLVKDALTGNIIGKGYQNDHPETVVLEPRTISNIQLAVALDYQARDFTDATFASLKSACISSSPSLPANNNTPNTNTTAPIINNGTIPIANATSTNTSTPTNSTNSTNANHLARRGPLDSDQHPASNVTTSNNSNTTQYPPIPNSHAPDQQQQPLSLLFWITLHIWGLDVFGYRPTVVATPANGGFLCPLS
ncbi:hypothetical protein DM01DRAFT_1339881 [Hesseltinella vesiculosa]|uniref:Uncharacterized protein n=1 Tax=Hesseltinella vesiculosa TaxID=101127 RepID=A0A1X2G5I7_9FUNG|nr:hypothetical protein DM01DRAFT_1339881 [Hesseltinella vesiculosa]